MPKRPSFQFYPADWRKDLALQACSFAARGLWIEMMCIMHESDAYGMLVLNPNASQNAPGSGPKVVAKVIDERELTRLVGGSPKVLKKLLEELEENGVFSRTEDGVIYCRRMVRDEHIRTVRAEAGAKGAAVTNAGRLPDELPQQTSRQNGRQNSGKRHPREGAPARPPAQSSSSSVNSLPTPASVADSPDVAAAVVQLPAIPNDAGKAAAVERKVTEERQKLQAQLDQSRSQPTEGAA